MWEIITGEQPQRGSLRLPRVPEECPQVRALRGPLVWHEPCWVARRSSVAGLRASSVSHPVLSMCAAHCRRGDAVYASGWYHSPRPLPMLTCASHLRCILLQDIADLMMECLTLEPSERPTVRLACLPGELWAGLSAALHRWRRAMMLIGSHLAHIRLVAMCYASGAAPTPPHPPHPTKQAAQVMQRLEGGRSALEAAAVGVPLHRPADGGPHSAPRSQ